MSYIQSSLVRTAVECKGHSITDSAHAIADFGFGAGNLASAKAAVITARTGGVMLTWDGTTPTATLGHYLGANQTLVVFGNANVQNLKLIREASTSADVTITLES